MMLPALMSAWAYPWECKYSSAWSCDDGSVVADGEIFGMVLMVWR